MYSYRKDKKLNKRKVIVTMGCVLAIAVSFFSYEYAIMRNEQETPVFKEEDVPVLALPDTTQKAIQPFDVSANVVLDYYDGNESQTVNMTKFEGVYRANQGIDYALDDQAFDVKSVFAGEVREVKDDAIFGKSITIASDDLSITYQSLGAIAVKQGDHVNQGDVLAQAGTNIYNKELGNHLHMVVEKNNVIINPKNIYGKTLEEIE